MNPFIQDVKTKARASYDKAREAAGSWYEGLSPSAQHRISKYGMAAKSGALSALGDQFVPTGGIQAGIGMSAKQLHAAQIGRQGTWRFMGGLGERAAMYKAARAGGAGTFGAVRGAARGLLGPALGLGFTLHAAYGGWKREGLWGVGKETAVSVAEWAAIDVAFTAVKPFIGYAVPVAIAAGVGYGGYKALEYGARRTRAARRFDFGGMPIDDQFGTISTMRQRSLMEMQRSHGAVRGALGTEAQLMHL